MNNKSILDANKRSLLSAGAWLVFIFFVGLTLGGLYVLKQNTSTKGYYLMGYFGVIVGSYLLSKALFKGEDVLFAWIVFLLFSVMTVGGLFYLKENLSTRGFYLMAYVGNMISGFLVSMIYQLNKYNTQRSKE